MNRTTAISEEVIASWYRGCKFSTDWTTYHFDTWINVLRELRSAHATVLEIGSWEGRSALFFLNYISRCQITCIDTFAGSDEHQGNPKFETLVSRIEHCFDANLEPFKSRVEKIKSTSQEALINLGLAKRRFDLVYVDGNHRAGDVYADAALSWPLLKPKGLLIFDDYGWPHGEDERDRPKLGIDAFLSNFANEYAIVSRGYQVIVQKTRTIKGGANAEKDKPFRSEAIRRLIQSGLALAAKSKRQR